MLIHGVLFYGLYRSRLSSKFEIPDNTVFVDLDKLPPPVAVPPAEKEKQRQIVETETAANQAKPKDAEYLGEHDQSVDQQTKARQVDIFRKGGVQSKAGSGGKPKVALKDLAPPSSKAITPPSQAEIDGMRERQKKELARQEHQAGGEQSADNPGSASNDWLKDVKESDRTLLNTKEFVYFSYYRRIRERLEVAWNSKLRSTLDSYVYGSRHLAQVWKNNGTAGKLKALINVDMIGDKDLNILQDTSSNRQLRSLVWKAAADLGYSRNFTNDAEQMDDDHMPFVQIGVPSLDLIDFDYPAWHTPADTLDKLSPQSLRIVGEVVSESIRRLERP